MSAITGIKWGRIEVARGKVTRIKYPSAFNSIYPTIFAMRYGAELPWLKDNVVVEQCPDPEHCVTFEIDSYKS